MTDREFRQKLMRHKRKRRDGTLKVIIFLLSIFVGFYAGVLVGLLYLAQGVIL